MRLLFALLCVLLATPAFADPAPLFELSAGDAQDAIGHGLSEKGAGDRILAVINGHKPTDALFSYAKPVEIEIHGLTFDKMGRRWSANLLMLSDGAVVSAMPVSGHFDEMIQAPVLKREVHRGEVIADADIELHDFPVAHTRTDMITDPAQLIGKSPERGISPMRPIRAHEIASPALIKKNAIVQMRYHAPGMEISTAGQALEEGAKGDVISLRNTASRKIVRAVIDDGANVTITAEGGSYAAN